MSQHTATAGLLPKGRTDIPLPVLQNESFTFQSKGSPNSGQAFRDGSISRPSETIRESSVVLGLAQGSPFAGFTDYEREKILQKSAEVHFSAGQGIQIRANEILVIISGEVSCALFDAAGGKHNLGTEGPGTLYGELQALVGRSPSDERVELRAKSDVHMISVPADFVMSIFLNNCESARSLAILQAQRLERMNSIVSTLVDPGLETDDHAPKSLGERMADSVTNHVGSWRFIIGSVAGVGLWIAANSFTSKVFGVAFDEHPYMLLNFVLSLSAALTAPAILISQKREEITERRRFNAVARMIMNIGNKINRDDRSQ